MAATTFTHGLKFIGTYADPDIQRDILAPDIGVYPKDNPPEGDAETDFSKMELFIQLKFADASDPFRDPEDPPSTSKWLLLRD
jgi:hypothetical protein